MRVAVTGATGVLGRSAVPALVAGGHEVVAEGDTGLLVDWTPGDPAGFEERLAAAVNQLARDPGQARRMGLAGRERAVREFGWDAVAARTVELYSSLG